MASNPFGGMVSALTTEKAVSTGLEPGTIYHRLTLTGAFRFGTHRNREAHAVCSCGNDGWFRVAMMKSGATKSCGCLRKELSTLRLVNGRRAMASNPLERTVDGKFKPRVK